jgi:hypothetical protein
VASLEILADQTPDLLGLAAAVLISGDRVLKPPPYVDCSASFKRVKFIGGCFLSLLKWP